MVVNKLPIQKLMEIGLTEYEAKAYVSLLLNHPATAYEAARHSGIPTSKVYQVLDRLMEKGMALQAEEAGKRRFTPIDPDELLLERRGRLDMVLGELSADLSALRTGETVSYIWNVRDYGALMEKAIRTIDGSKRTCLLSLWPAEAAAVSGSVRAAAERGVRSAAVLFGEISGIRGTVYRHPIEDTLYQEKGGRGFVLVADGSEAVTGTILTDGTVQGAWSRDSGFVTLAEDYVKHDIYIMKIVERFDDELVDRFGRNYRLLRDVFSDREVRK